MYLATADFMSHQSGIVHYFGSNVTASLARFGALLLTPHAAFAMAATRSHVVARMLGRAFILSRHCRILGEFAVSGSHSGVAAKKSTCGARITSANVIDSPTKYGPRPNSRDSSPNTT